MRKNFHSQNYTVVGVTEQRTPTLKLDINRCLTGNMYTALNTNN